MAKISIVLILDKIISLLTSHNLEIDKVGNLNITTVPRMEKDTFEVIIRIPTRKAKGYE